MTNPSSYWLNIRARLLSLWFSSYSDIPHRTAPFLFGVSYYLLSLPHVHNITLHFMQRCIYLAPCIWTRSEIAILRIASLRTPKSPEILLQGACTVNWNDISLEPTCFQQLIDERDWEIERQPTFKKIPVSRQISCKRDVYIGYT